MSREFIDAIASGNNLGAEDDWQEIQEHIQYDFLADGHFAELKDAELLENRLNQLQTVESYIGTFISKEYVLKKILRMTDTEIQEMRDQIASEVEKDPMDGGIVVPAGGDGIKRIPTDQGGNPIDPYTSSDEREKMGMGVPPAEEGGEEVPPEEAQQ